MLYEFLEWCEMKSKFWKEKSILLIRERKEFQIQIKQINIAVKESSRLFEEEVRLFSVEVLFRIFKCTMPVATGIQLKFSVEDTYSTI